MFCCNLDLRFFLPPLINYLLFLMKKSQIMPWWSLHDELILEGDLFWFLAILAILIFFFLVTSIKLPLNFTLTTHPIRVQTGNLSGPVALAFAASLLLPQPHFWVLFTFILCISPWYTILLGLIISFALRVFRCLRAIPTLLVICLVQRQQHPETETELPRVEFELVEDEGFTQHEQPIMEYECP